LSINDVIDEIISTKCDLISKSMMIDVYIKQRNSL